MGDVLDLTERLQQRHSDSHDSSEMSLQEMRGMFLAYAKLIDEMIGNGAEKFPDNIMADFKPIRVAILVGDGKTVLNNGLNNFSGIELLGLNAKIKQLVFED